MGRDGKTRKLAEKARNSALPLWEKVMVVGGLWLVGGRRGTFIGRGILWIALRFGICRLHACGVGVFKVCRLQREER